MLDCARQHSIVDLGYDLGYNRRPSRSRIYTVMTKAADKKKFRAIGHHLKPIVTVAGNGLSESVMSEISRALTDHELIKVKVLAEDRSDRKTLIQTINEANQSEIIQTIGNMALLYRAAEKPNPALSNILRSGLL